MNTTDNNSDLIISIPCVGKTRVNYRVLKVYEDHLLMYNSDKGEIIFDEKYSDMVSLSHKKKSSLLRCLMVLEMKDGTKYDITLDDRHTLSGKYTKYSNPEINQLSKTLPGFINKRIEQSRVVNKSTSQNVENAKKCDNDVSGTKKFCIKCGNSVDETQKFCVKCGNDLTNQ